MSDDVGAMGMVVGPVAIAGIGFMYLFSVMDRDRRCDLMHDRWLLGFDTPQQERKGAHAALVACRAAGHKERIATFTKYLERTSLSEDSSD